MTKTVFETRLDEIKFLRFICAKCSARLDLPVKQIRKYEECPSCGDRLTPTESERLEWLRRMINDIQQDRHPSGKLLLNLSFPTEKESD